MSSRSTDRTPIVSVYPLASLVLGRMRRKKLLRVPVLTYLTDFAVHSLWVHPGIDRHLAVSEISAAGCADRAAARTRSPAGRSSATGSAYAEYDRDAMRSSLGLDPDDRAVLVVAGSWGVGDVVAHRRGDREVGRVPPHHGVRAGREAAAPSSMNADTAR